MSVIRRAGPADAAGMAAVHVASWRSTYPGLLPTRYLVGLDARSYAERWRRMLGDPRGGRGCFVAVEEAKVVGFGWCGGQRSSVEGYGGEFYALYLLDHVQGTGLGRRMMATMAEELLGRGHFSALVWVLRDNPARFFYERLGGARVAEHPIDFAGSRLTEVAYGWRDLMPLARLSAGPRVR
ncbi:GNAT family N-acetyltransferase [Arenibaculum pallidiluteum]|uniref:GNAT family N-acetyltransferase n=1 Tax=Arenibaculum pallidiluteum TaxID=2812559 RepID=UPI002E2D678C|nr:GNAT family N-acetyltransferase [Arenibaculum pallidiluteum]